MELSFYRKTGKKSIPPACRRGKAISQQFHRSSSKVFLFASFSLFRKKKKALAFYST
jgi:hypothetical protein